MKKLLILAATLFTLSAHAQNVIYLFGMNASGQPVINSVAIPNIVNTGSLADLLNATSLQLIPTIHANVTRPINSTAFTVSTTKIAWVHYTVNISCTATIGSTASGKVALQYFDTGTSTWIDVQDASNSNTVSLAIVLNSINAQDMEISGEVAANTQLRMVSTVVGTTTITWVRGFETY